MTPQFAFLFRRHVVRHVRRHRLLALLNVLSIALGIAVYLAIQIANHSANRSFAAAIDMVAGKSNLEARGDIDEKILPRLLTEPAVKAVTPLVEGIITLPDFPGEYLQVLGVDIFTNAPFQTFELGAGEGGRFEFENWLRRPDGIAITEAFGRRHSLKVGDTLRALVNSRIRAVRVNSLMKLTDTPAQTNERFAAMDIGWAQELLGQGGRLSSIQILLRDPERGEEAAEKLQRLFPPDVLVAPPRQRSFQIEKMIGAFQLNLSALSMVSMLVGMFLIYNTISASVARRRVEIGILRAIGATRMEVRVLFLSEAFLYGVLGIVLGALGGVVLANFLVGSVAKTISSLYLLVSVDRFFFSAPQLLKAACLGMGAVLVAAWFPANEAAEVDPAQAMSLGIRMEHGRFRKGGWFVAALVSLAVAMICSWMALNRGPAWMGFTAAFFVLFGFAFLAPAAVSCFGGMIEKAAALCVLVRVAAENLHRAVHRSAMTVAALAAAIAMMIAVTVMIFSFRRSVDAWIDRGIVADLFIAPASNEIVGLSAFVPPETIHYLESRDGVEAVDTFRELGTIVEGQPAALAVVKGADRRNLKFAGGGERGKMAKFFGGDYVVVTESFARKSGKRDGDRIRIPSPSGLVEFEIAGTYSDYTRDQGVILLDRKNFDRHWNDPRVQSLAVYLKKGADAERLGEEFRQRFGAQGEYIVYSNRTLRARILEIFDQTFAVTYLLRVIAIVVAIAGIFLSVTTLVKEREKEIGVLRAIGASRGQVQVLFVVESGFIGFLSSALGIAGGACLSMVLTWVVNKAFFGWTIALEFPWGFLMGTPLWIVPVSLIAAWFPAIQAGRTQIAAAVRME